MVVSIYVDCNVCNDLKSNYWELPLKCYCIVDSRVAVLCVILVGWKLTDGLLLSFLTDGLFGNCFAGFIYYLILMKVKEVAEENWSATTIDGVENL